MRPDQASKATIRQKERRDEYAIGRHGATRSERSCACVIPAGHRFYWSVRRELWENRSLYLAPLAVAALFLVGFLISAIHPPAQIACCDGAGSDAASGTRRAAVHLRRLLFMATTFIVSIFYCLDALHGERRDRSILFWKSLPVSDLTTVLAKASIPLLILPLLTFAVTLVTQCIMLLLSSAVMLARGQSVATLWSHLPLFQMSVMLLFHLVAIHGLWYAPIYCWMLLVSAWARRAPFSGPCYRRWRSSWRRRLPLTRRISAPCWRSALAAARRASPSPRARCRWLPLNHSM